MEFESKLELELHFRNGNWYVLIQHSIRRQRREAIIGVCLSKCVNLANEMISMIKDFIIFIYVCMCVCSNVIEKKSFVVNTTFP